MGFRPGLLGSLDLANVSIAGTLGQFEDSKRPSYQSWGVSQDFRSFQKHETTSRFPSFSVKCECPGHSEPAQVLTDCSRWRGVPDKLGEAKVCSKFRVLLN